MQNNNRLKILFVSAEVSPFAKTGGLADVAGSLPQALSILGNDVRVAMPKYRVVKSGMEYVTDFPVKMDERVETAIVRSTDIVFDNNGERKSVPIYFVDNYHYYDREGIYCHCDDGDRFAFFCNAVLEMLPKIDFQPDIIHCNDWQMGPICMLLNEKYKNNSFYSDIATLFTIHNLQYQGHFSKDTLKMLNLDEKLFVPEKSEFYGMFNFMKTGIVYSDVINTVSERYSKEIKTEKFGEKLEGLLGERSDNLFGIVNGISYEEFNPQKDNRLYKNYNEENYQLKKENKYALQKEFGLPIKDVPLIGIVTRITEQKGLSLVLEKMDKMMEEDIQFVLLGVGDERLEDSFKAAKEKYPDKIALYFGFSETLAHKIYASIDIFLMPSLFEPCGLGQIISLRYGAIPIVRATGGLAETVIDYDKDNINGNGFVFEEFLSEEMLKCFKRAVNIYKNEPDKWARLVKRALSLDFSWDKPAKKYMDLYQRALNNKHI